LRDEQSLCTPAIQDAERLQGFRASWTDVEKNGSLIREGARWKMVGNAVSVPKAQWLGERLISPAYKSVDSSRYSEWQGGTWPNAAFNLNGKIIQVKISEYPKKIRYKGLREFLRHPTKPLSFKATSGFLNRAGRSKLRFPSGLLEMAKEHAAKMKKLG
jgi:DNA (cytosine-5)-methyltransferase 1